MMNSCLPDDSLLLLLQWEMASNPTRQRERDTSFVDCFAEKRKDGVRLTLPEEVRACDGRECDDAAPGLVIVFA